ncbi:fimbrial protein, partial [Salmonella enterica]|nr:fimbrial protein [Salmonella enterica]EKS5830145.1 fimbrial protein [Salmonella enterica]
MMSTVPAFAAPNDPISTTDAGQGTIQFTGSVIDAPCSIPSDSQNIQVDLGQVNLKRLDAENKHSDAVPVTINLTGCSFTEGDAGKPAKLSKVAVTFPGVQTPSAEAAKKNGEIVNGASDAATNVVIQLLKADGTSPVDLSNATPPTEGDIQLDATSSTNKLQFFAQILATGTATAGNVGATVT